MDDLPAPLEWHPAYRHMPWLIDWLNGEGKYARMHELIIPFMPSMRLWAPVDDPVAACMALDRRHTLTKQCAWGAAPYVGHPFVYVWHVGVDELGRAIAGESRIVYTDERRP